MYVVHARNVNEAYTVGLNMLIDKGWAEPSRMGDVVSMAGPVTTSYTEPCERVLFNAQRDANPFFHFMEGLWMLAGRRDVEWIERYNNTFKQFSDDGVIFNAAYGYRWRHQFETDQLDTAIRHLQEDPTSRRCVVSMWDPNADFDKQGKDFPCNLNIAFRVLVGSLHMTVFNRSNDIIWGAYGANAVHMSMMQEYMAGMLDLKVGHYNQVSNNYHAYKDIMAKVGQPDPHPLDPYDRGEVAPYPMVTNKVGWNMDLMNFMLDPVAPGDYADPFFYEVARPMAQAWELHKSKNYAAALSTADTIVASDWKIACKLWLKRRMENYATKNATEGRGRQTVSYD